MPTRRARPQMIDDWYTKNGRQVWVSGLTVGLRHVEAACDGTLIRDETEARRKGKRIETVNDKLHEQSKNSTRTRGIRAGHGRKNITNDRVVTRNGAVERKDQEVEAEITAAIPPTAMAKASVPAFALTFPMIRQLSL